MKKRLFALFAALLCLLCVFALVSCDEDPPEGELDSACEHRDEDGDDKCDKCNESYNDSDDETPCSHTPIHHAAVAATTTTAGNTEYWECTACDTYFSDEACTEKIADKASVVIPALGETVITPSAHYTRTGNTIYFGAYPQSEVEDATLITALNQAAGTLPTEDNAQAWTSYGYYNNDQVKHYMWYIDLTAGGEHYRGVYFTEYRPICNAFNDAGNNGYQDDNGYFTSTTYWFKYDPIAWSVLSENDGTALLLCNMVIDAQAYQDKSIYEGMHYTALSGAPTGTYADDYAYSTIRVWLNETFFETAFGTLSQAVRDYIILETELEHSGSSIEDKVFLLTVEDVLNAEYGFAAGSSVADSARQRQTTAYARAQGAFSSSAAEGTTNHSWWLRTPYYNTSILVSGVGSNGDAEYGCDARNSFVGVVPALQIRL